MLQRAMAAEAEAAREARAKVMILFYLIFTGDPTKSSQGGSFLALFLPDFHLFRLSSQGDSHLFFHFFGLIHTRH